VKGGEENLFFVFLTFSTGESLALGSGEILWIIIDIKNVESSS